MMGSSPSAGLDTSRTEHDMTEQVPVNLAAAEQRLVEELTGETPPVEEHEPDAAEPGDPMPPPEDESTRSD